MADEQSTVTYRDIPGFPGYRVGDDGSVWTCWEKKSPPTANRHNRTGRTPWRIGQTWRRLSLNYKKNKNRYVVEVSGKTCFVHQLILLSFVGPCPVGMEACHNDGNRTNNRADNLRWDTKKANAADRDRHGTTARGSRTGGSKMTDEMVKQIHYDYSTGQFSQRSLARKFGITQSTLSDILLRKTWRHVSLPEAADQAGAPAPTASA